MKLVLIRYFDKIFVKRVRRDPIFLIKSDHMQDDIPDFLRQIRLLQSFLTLDKIFLRFIDPFDTHSGRCLQQGQAQTINITFEEIDFLHFDFSHLALISVDKSIFQNWTHEIWGAAQRKFSFLDRCRSFVSQIIHDFDIFADPIVKELPGIFVRLHEVTRLDISVGHEFRVKKSCPKDGVTKDREKLSEGQLALDENILEIDLAF